MLPELPANLLKAPLGSLGLPDAFALGGNLVKWSGLSILPVIVSDH